MRISYLISRDYHLEIPERTLLAGLFLLLIFLAAACQMAASACPPESVTYLQEEDTPHVTENWNNPAAEQLVEINGQETLVDLVVQGTLCSGSWSGTVYVPCKVQVYAWEEDPLFLENCDLSIAPGTTVYVAAHNDQPYYQGCSCHTGDE